MTAIVKRDQGQGSGHVTQRKVNLSEVFSAIERQVVFVWRLAFTQLTLSTETVYVDVISPCSLSRHGRWRTTPGASCNRLTFGRYDKVRRYGEVTLTLMEFGWSDTDWRRQVCVNHYCCLWQFSHCYCSLLLLRTGQSNHPASGQYKHVSAPRRQKTNGH